MKNAKLIIVAALLTGLLVVVLGMPAIAGDKGEKGGKKHLHIPPGHLPPAGKCRIWYPGTPPGHQPPAGDCRTLSRELPRGAMLVSRDRVWSYEDRPGDFYRRHYVSRPDWRDDHPYPRDCYDGRSKREIRNDIRDVREARKDVREDREQLRNNIDELKKDRAELRRDIREGASKKEIRQDRREIREDAQKIRESKQDLRQSRNKLEAARGELKDDLRRR